MKLDGLQNYLEALQKDNPKLKNLFLHKGDGRTGKIIALARKMESGAIDTKSEFYNHKEMHAYLRGIDFQSR